MNTMTDSPAVRGKRKGKESIKGELVIIEYQLGAFERELARVENALARLRIKVIEIKESL